MPFGLHKALKLWWLWAVNTCYKFLGYSAFLNLVNLTPSYWCPLQFVTLICDLLHSSVLHLSTKPSVICIQEGVFVFNVCRAAILILSSPKHYWLLSMHVQCIVLLLFVIEYVLLLCINQQNRVSFVFKRVSFVNRLVLWASTELDVDCRIQNLQLPSVHYLGQPSFDDYLRNLEQLTSSWVRFGLFITILFPDNLIFLD